MQDATLTVQGEIVGTPAYMAPEQAEGRLDQIDQRTDIYRLGAILYAILTGRPPFVGSNTMEVLTKAMRGNPAPPREICSEVPLALDEICVKAMAKEPERRYASAADLAQEVQRWQEVQRRQAEDALRESQQQFHTLDDSIPQLAWMADAAGYIFWYRPRPGRDGDPPLGSQEPTRRNRSPIDAGFECHRFAV